MPTIARALLIVAVAGAFTRACGELLPSQLALIIAMATVVGLPGWALASAARLPNRLDTVTLLGLLPVTGLAAWIPALSLGFVVGLDFNQVMGLVAVQTVALLSIPGPAPSTIPRPDAVALGLAAPLVALAATRWQEALAGDEIFHLARARKLLAVPHLSLDSVTELAGGRPHAGYVVPLLHAVEAAALRVSGIDPSVGFPDLVPAATVLMVFAVYAAGRAVGGSAVGAATVVLAVWASMIGTHPDLGMASWPGPFTFLILFPATVVALTELVRTPEDRRLAALLAACALVVSLVHISYVVPLLAMIVGSVAYARRGVVGAVAAGTVGVATGAFVWWEALHGAPKPVIAEGPWQHATSQAFVMVHDHAVAVNAQTILAGQTGFVIALAGIVPLLLWRAPSYAYPVALMAGGLVLVALPGFVPVLNGTVGIGQTHRFGAAVPWEVAAAVLCALAVTHARRRWIAPALVVLAIAAVAGPSRIQSVWSFRPEVPTTPAAIVVIAGAVWYAVRRFHVLPRIPVEAPVVPTLAVAVVAVMLSDPSSLRTVASDVAHGRPRVPPSTIPAGVVDWIARHGGTMPVILADELRSYRLGAYVDAYVVAAPEVRTRSEPGSYPEQRRRDVQEFLSAATAESTRDAMLRRYGVDIVIVPSNRPALLRQLESDPLLRRRTVPAGGGDWVIFTTST